MKVGVLIVLLAIVYLVSSKKADHEMDERRRELIRDKRWIFGAVAALGRVAGMAASGAARIGAGAGHGLARVGLGAARLGGNIGNAGIRTVGNIGHHGVRLGQAGVGQIRSLASRGARFVARNPKRIAGELLLFGGHMGLSHLLAPHNNGQQPNTLTPVNGQDYAVDCTEGWTHLPSEGQCYAKAPMATSYTQAAEVCQQAYADLAMPKSVAEKDVLIEVINSTQNSWIGLNDITREGQFVWEDDKPISWVNWAPGRTNQNYEDCVYMSSDGKWRISYCLESYNFVCQTPEVRAFDVFETGTYEWELVFRGTAGVQTSVYDAFINYQTETVESGCRQLRSDQPCYHHYRNNLAIDSWSYVDEVAYVMYKDGLRVAHVVFDGNGSNQINWFTQSKVKRSSFTDLQVSANIFSLEGDAANQRNFFINHRYGGCNVDEGWMVAVSGQGCSWEARGSQSSPRFLYARNGNKANWQSGPVGDADVLAVFVKYAVPE